LEKYNLSKKNPYIRKERSMSQSRSFLRQFGTGEKCLDFGKGGKKKTIQVLKESWKAN